ncbi:hypothetical protein [Salipaludibacillus daqingensis]|uniref:hypothetical protein n=1 Tax=Salipaludibacillus daqingensis TaxID=3041001 RepID=UPI002475C555|nr:hypothetical protein [Salipaludibacillus daqingensis]
MVKHKTDKKPFSCKVLIFLHVFLGVGAVFGGGAFIIDNTGEIINMPISLLESTPFTNFFVPGLILFFILGIIPLIIAISLLKTKERKRVQRFNLFKDNYWAWSFSLYIGFALIIWINVQVFLINAVEVVHLVYIGIGVAIQAVTLLPSVQQYYKIEEK